MSFKNIYSDAFKCSTEFRSTKKPMTSKLKPIILLTLIFASLVTALPIFSSSKANAAELISVTNKNNYDWQIKSILYLKAIDYCAKNTQTGWYSTVLASNAISIESAKNGSWFDGGNLADVGVYVKDAFSGDPNLSSKITKFFEDGSDWDGKLHCSDSKVLVRQALNLWGLDAITTLCNSGFKSIDYYNSDGTAIDYVQTPEICINYASKSEARGLLYNIDEFGSGTQNISRLTNYIKQSVYGGVSNDPGLPSVYIDPTLNTDISKYYFYRHSLNESCIANIDSTAPDSNNNGSADSTIKNVKWIDVASKTVLTGSYITKSNTQPSSTKNLGYINSDGSVLKLTCTEMTARMSSLADGVLASIIADSTITITPPDTNASVTKSKSSCTIPSVGWILCPIINTMGKIIDGSWGLISKMLTTDVSIVNSGTSATPNPAFSAWKIMQGIANVAFVIAFLIIIFSQVTSIGVTNYGIKKLLPRLIIAAILVNVSFYICQIAVDLSNILGGSIKGVFDGLGTTVYQPEFTGTIANPGGIIAGVIGAGVGIAAFAAWASLGTLIPVLLAGIVAIVMILFILIARQALIILLVVLSPLAFVAYLLPNTEKLFQKWQKAFTAMLLVYPIVAMVIGGSSFAATILKNVYVDPTDPNSSIIASIVAAAVAILPLFVVPGLLKKSLDGVGSIGGKISGFGDKLGKNAGNKYTNSNFGKYQKTKHDTDVGLQRAGAYSGRNPFKKAASFGNRTLNNAGVKTGILGEYAGLRQASGIQLGEKQDADNRKIAASRLKYMNLNKAQQLALAQGESVYKTYAEDVNGNMVGSGGVILDGSKDRALQEAAVEGVVASTNKTDINTLWNHARQNWGNDASDKIKNAKNQKFRTVLADSLQGQSNRSIWTGGGAIAGLRLGTQDTASNETRKAIKTGKYSAEKIVDADKDDLANVLTEARAMSAEDRYNLVMSARKGLTDDRLKSRIQDNRPQITNISNLSAAAPAPQPAAPQPAAPQPAAAQPAPAPQPAAPQPADRHNREQYPS